VELRELVAPDGNSTWLPLLQEIHNLHTVLMIAELPC
jgi:hypothetical protein